MVPGPWRHWRLSAAVCSLVLEGWALILGALLVLTLPLGYLAAAILAAAWHEACHALAVLALGGKVLSLRLGLGGARMETSPLDPLPGAICALAGPAGSFLLLGLSHWFPQIAAWGLLQGCFNLLPIYPLDGGQALRRLAPCLAPWVEGGTMLALGLLALYAVFFGGTGAFPLAVLAGLAVGRKKPCKSGRFRVQ